MIIFEQTLEDSLAFNSYYLKNNLSFFQKNWRWLLVIIFSFYVFKNSGWTIESFINWGNWFMILFVGLIAFLLTRLSTFMKTKSIMAFVENNPQSVGRRQIDFDEEKVTVSTNSVSTDYKYSAFLKVVESEDYYFAYIGKQSALILPKRIPDKEELSKLVENIRTK